MGHQQVRAHQSEGLLWGSSSEGRQSRSRWVRVRVRLRRTEPAESLRRSVAFQWFFTAFSVRPTITFAMSAHLLATTGGHSGPEVAGMC